MPTYEYRCDHCGHTFSAQQRYDDPPVAECPKCAAHPRKLVSLPAIVFKGTGWHVTDYRAKSPDASSDGAKDAKPKDATKEPTKDAGDTKGLKDSASKKESAPAKPDGSSGPAAKSS